MKYAVYNKLTGEIVFVGVCSPRSLAERHVTETRGVIWGVPSRADVTHHVVDGKLVKKEKRSGPTA